MAVQRLLPPLLPLLTAVRSGGCCWLAAVAAMASVTPTASPTFPSDSCQPSPAALPPLPSPPALPPPPPSPPLPAAAAAAGPPPPLSSSPLLEFVCWACERCVAALVAPSPSVSAPPALSFAWFRSVWRSSGCRLLPLLALSMQSQRHLLHSTAWCPPADAPNPSTFSSSPLYRPCSFPSANIRPLLHSAYDTLTHTLTQPATTPLLQRLMVYYTLYTLHHTQLTVEKYPIPCTRHAWSTVCTDMHVRPPHSAQHSQRTPHLLLLCLPCSSSVGAVCVCVVWLCVCVVLVQLLSSLPVLDAALVLRSMIDERSARPAERVTPSTASALHLTLLSISELCRVVLCCVDGL